MSIQYSYNDDDINRMIQKLDSIHIDGVEMLANEALNFYIDSFNNQGFTDESFEPWQKVDKAGATLIQSGNLRNSIEIFETSKDGFTIGSNLEYADIHNEGGQILITDRMKKFFMAKYKSTGDEKYLILFKYSQNHSTINIPKRTFISDSKTLADDLIEFILKYII